MTQYKIELTGELEVKQDLFEGIRFTSEALTDEDITIQIGVSAITMSKRDLIHIIDSSYIDMEFEKEVEEASKEYFKQIAISRDNEEDYALEKAYAEASDYLDELDEEVDGSDTEG